MSTNLDAGIAISVARLDTLQVILDVEIQSTFSVCLLQVNSFHARRASYLLRDNLPATSIHDKRTVFAYETKAMITSVCSIVDTDSMIPQDSKPIEGIDCLQQVRCFTGIIGIAKLATRSHNRLRRSNIHSIKRIIQEVNAPVGHQSTGIIPEPSPSEMEAIAVERPFGSRTKPHLVIHAGRDSFIWFHRN